MTMSKRSKHRNTVVVAGLATAAALAGGVGVAAAGGPSGPPDSSAPSAQSESTEGTEEQEPSLNGSIPATEIDGETEQQEEARLSSDAKVSQAEAEAAALRAVPGTVTASELGNENGSLVWEVDVQQADGSAVEVKVDAGDGTVLAQEADDEGDEGTSESEDGGQDEADEQDEAGEATTG